MNVLRQATRPLTVRQIAIEVLRQIGSDEPDRKVLQRTQNAIDAFLRKHRGIIGSIPDAMAELG